MRVKYDKLKRVYMLFLSSERVVLVRGVRIGAAKTVEPEARAPSLSFRRGRFNLGTRDSC
jgi:hypothetical protein